MPLPEPVLRGIAEFNRREFFEAHETLEDVWAEENGRLRTFYQGLIQIAVACCHIQRGNWEGASHLFAKGVLKVREGAGACPGIDAAGLLVQVERCEAEARRLVPGRLDEFNPALFPVVRVVPD
jgi:predicted metal-dependent hydrolase